MHRAPQELRTYFITTVTADRHVLFKTHNNARLFVETLHHYRSLGKYSLHAYVVMPDHVHLLITPAPDVSLEKAIQLIKGGFSFRLKSSFPIWERSYDNRRVTDSHAYDSFVGYIHQNPIKAKLAPRADGYFYSSAAEILPLYPKPTWFETRA